MPVADLSHYLVRANDIDTTRDFYVNVLGFEVMPRPYLPFPGYWLGVGGNIQVHIAQHGVELADLYYIGSPANAATDHAGVIDHIAFIAADPKGMAAHLKVSGAPYRARFMADSKLYQLFVTDPNGICIELNFFGVTDAAEWADGDVEIYSEMPRS